MTRHARAVVVVSLLSASWALAQDSSIRGELTNVPGRADQLSVQLVQLDRSANPQTAYATSGGSFQFRSVPQGQYMLQVKDLHGNIVKQQMITVVGPNMETSISLGGRAQSAMPEGAPTVSVNQLRHDPDGRAGREYTMAEQYLLKQDLPNARKHLLKALKADPDYADAHLELGTTAFRSGHVEEAKSEFERAVQLDPKQTVAWGNLASLLFQTKAFDDAENTAHQGLKTSPEDSKLHFIAGASSLARGNVNQDAVDHLERASRNYPNAHLLLAEAMIRLGQFKNVLMHLEASLVSNNADVRARAQALIQRLPK